jgi:hypothetical protein
VPGVNFIRERKMVMRVRLLLGVLLLFAAVLTWGIGLSLSPHAKVVVAGTEHLRSTVVTFKRNSAIGTLLLSAIASWMLFPRLRPRRPVRDWAVIVLVASLAASSAYTLLSFRGSLAKSTGSGEHLATSSVNEVNAGEVASNSEVPNMSGGAAYPLSARRIDTQIPSFNRELKEQAAPEKLVEPLEHAATDVQANTSNTSNPHSDDGSTNDEVLDNQE